MKTLTRPSRIIAPLDIIVRTPDAILLVVTPDHIRRAAVSLLGTQPTDLPDPICIAASELFGCDCVTNFTLCQIILRDKADLADRTRYTLPRSAETLYEDLADLCCTITEFSDAALEPILSRVPATYTLTKASN